MIAPDLVGFGRSDKPADRRDYTYARHVEWLRALLRRKPRKVAAVALANKMARTAWAMMTSGEAHRRPAAANRAVAA